MSPYPLVATSGDKKTRVVVEMTGKVLVYRKGEKKPQSVSRWERFGHHLDMIVSHDASSIALVDDYAGMEILDANGKRKAFLSPDKLLSSDELANTPHQWACHPEGQWVVKPNIRISAGFLSFSLYNGRKIDLPIKAKK